MVNKKGAIVSTCKIDAKLHIAIFKKSFFTVLALLAVSVLGFATEIVLMSTHNKNFDLIMLICFCILFALSIALLGMHLFGVFKSKSANTIYCCEIYAEHMLCQTYENDNKISELKVEYKSTFTVKETKNYFLVYVNKSSLCPVSKKDMSPAEQNAARKLFRLPPKPADGAIFVPASAFSAEAGLEVPSNNSAENTHMCSQTNAPQHSEVFEEFSVSDGKGDVKSE